MKDDLALIGLDRLRLGHLCHFANLARQLSNQWEKMKGKGYRQEDLGGYRLQLTCMAYALALTHRRAALIRHFFGDRFGHGFVQIHEVLSLNRP